MTDVRFWKTTSMEEMSGDEWDSLCDGCGMCYLEKVEDENTGEIRLIGVSCEYLDLETCQCMVYEIRTVVNSNCTKLTPKNIHEKTWLPRTCAYRTLMEGRDLAWWHPLVSGDPATVHSAGISVQDKVISGEFVHPKDME